MNSDISLENLNPGACKTFVVATRMSASRSTVLMRTYNYYLSTNASLAAILQAVRLPTLFLPIFINNIEYTDGGGESNNPVQLALDKAHTIWTSCSITCVVSIGIGLEESIQLGDNQKEAMHRLLSITFSKVAFHIDIAKWCVKLLNNNYNQHLRFAAHITDVPFTITIFDSMRIKGLIRLDLLTEIKG